MKTSIDLKETNQVSVITELTKVLADENVLYIKTKNAHWNVEGADFYNKYIFFESQIGQLYEVIDDVAERIRILGHYAPASLNTYLGLTNLTEQTSSKNDSISLIEELLEDHQTIILLLRENFLSSENDLLDAGTIDFITVLVQKHEKMAWFLRSQIKN